MAKIYQFKKVRNMSVPITTISSVAKTFLNMESMTPKKLQKLCYYAYGWYLAIEKEPLFQNKFEAWIHGPVDPGLYTEYKEYGWNEIEKENSVPNDILEVPEIMEFLDEVYSSYGHLDGNQLEYLTHREDPWKKAREGLKPYEPSNNDISDDSIMEFFSKELE